MNAGNAGTDVVVNRTASQLRTSDGLARVIAAAASAGGARLHETSDLEDLEHVARDIAARGSDTVVFAGGDGSYMAGLSALSRAYGPSPLPRVALAPGGTVCTVARNFGMRGRAGPWAERMLRAACDATTPTASRPTLRVRDDGGGDRVGFIFGTGLVARFFDAYYEAPRPGRAAAASLVARIFVGSFAGGRLAETVLRPTRAVLKIDGAVHSARDWNLVLASVVRDVGLHMLVPYRAGEENERFHLVASGLPARALARQLPRVLAGKPLGGEPRVDTLARALRVAFEDTGGSYVLDGDKFGARAVTVEPGPVLAVVRAG